MKPSAVIAVAGAALCAAALAAEPDGFAFMPPGGRTVLAELLPPGDAALMAETASRTASAKEWADWARQRDPALSDTAVETFAGYAALNFPVGADAGASLAASGDPQFLPPDGKDLAIAHCQFCHSLFSGYLMQDRDEVSWLSTFKSPFHAEIPMTEVERETFANYSARNMPLKFQDVPPELRF